MMSHNDFDRIIADAVSALPDQFRSALRNVAIVVEDAPTAEQLTACAIPDGESLYAFYEGVALPDREIEEPILPDRIVIFQRPLEEDFGHDPRELRQEVIRTILHEIAHHFGIDDARLEDIGKY